MLLGGDSLGALPAGDGLLADQHVVISNVRRVGMHRVPLKRRRLEPQLADGTQGLSCGRLFETSDEQAEFHCHDKNKTGARCFR